MSPESITKSIAIYCRVSKVGGREGDSYISPELQEQKCRQALEIRGLTPGDVFLDEDISGGKMKRPELEKALAQIESGESGGIIVARLDRFARTVVGGLQTLERIDKAGGAFITADGDFDTSTAVGELALNMMLSFGQFELRRLREGWKSSRGNARERGVYTAKLPFGFTSAGKGQPLVADPETSAYVAGIFERRVTGQTWSAIAAWLNEDGVPKRYSKTAWSQSDVSKIVANDVYRGKATFVEDGSPVEVELPRLVSDDLWYGVRAIVERNGKGGGAAPRRHDAVIGGGFVRCASCGKGLTRTTSTERNGQKWGFYICRNGACSAKASISAKALEPFVYQRLSEVALVKVEEPFAADAARDAAKAAVEAAERAIEGFDSTWVDEGLDPAAAISMRKALEVKLDDARKRLAEIPVDVVDWRAQVRDYARSWNKLLGDVIDEERAIEEVGRQFTEGVTGAQLVEMLQDGGPTAREIVRANLRSVVVRGKSGTPGRTETPESVAARVTIHTL